MCEMPTDRRRSGGVLEVAFPQSSKGYEKYLRKWYRKTYIFSKNNYYFLLKSSEIFGGFIFLLYLCINKKEQ